MEIKIRKVQESAKLPACHNGDWIDLYTNYIEVFDEQGQMVYASNVQGDEYATKKGYTVAMYLGVAMQLPAGYEGRLLPRSSTYHKTGLIMGNSEGVIDNNYCGDYDEWLAKFYCTLDNKIVKVGERYTQFRITAKQPDLDFILVDTLGNPSRGGFGSTDLK